MVLVRFNLGNYEIINDNEEVVSIKNNVWEALVYASRITKNDGFKVICNVPDDFTSTKDYYKCMVCGGAMKLNSSNTTGDIKFGKEDYIRCNNCDLNFIAIWVQDSWREE